MRPCLSPPGSSAWNLGTRDFDSLCSLPRPRMLSLSQTGGWPLLCSPPKGQSSGLEQACSKPPGARASVNLAVKGTRWTLSYCCPPPLSPPHLPPSLAPLQLQSKSKCICSLPSLAHLPFQMHTCDLLCILCIWRSALGPYVNYLIC